LTVAQTSSRRVSQGFSATVRLLIRATVRLSATVRLLLCATVVIACAAPPATTPLVSPEWDSVPSGVIDVLCTRLRDDAISTVAVVKTTQRIATPQGLAVLGASYGKRTSNDRITAALAASQRSVPVDAKSSVCTVTPIDRLDGRLHGDFMILELSTPLANPFARNEAGLFARVSLGGQHPAWYWIPLGHTGGQWIAGQALPLLGM
jgi:hypothetical protein